MNRQDVVKRLRILDDAGFAQTVGDVGDVALQRIALRRPFLFQTRADVQRGRGELKRRVDGHFELAEVETFGQFSGVFRTFRVKSVNAHMRRRNKEKLANVRRFGNVFERFQVRFVLFDKTGKLVEKVNDPF